MIDYGEYLMQQAGEDLPDEYVEPDDEYTGDEDGQTDRTDERVGAEDGAEIVGEVEPSGVEKVS